MVACGALLIGFSVQASAQRDPKLDEGWSNATLFRANDAQQDFLQAAKNLPAKREADFGQAVSLLNVQPKTDANLDLAAALFQSIRKSQPDDDLGIASLYFLARIEQYQRLPPDMPQAEKYYRELVARYPHHFWGEQAAIRLALLEIYQAPTRAEQISILADYDKLGDQFVDPNCRRDLFNALGRSYLNLRLSPERALEDLLKTQETGFSLAVDRADAYVRIGELARTLGRNNVAITYYKKLATEFPFDFRVYTIKQRLDQLQRNTPMAGAP